MNNIYIPLRIWQSILEYLDFLSKIRLRQVSKKLYQLSIYDFDNIPFEYKPKLTDEILLQHKNIKYLNTNNNHNITDVNHLTLLTKLKAEGKCGISDSGISDCINLKDLRVLGNSKITHVNHCLQLKKLDASWIMSDDSIKDCLNLKELFASGCYKITNVNHLKSLEVLDASCSGISDSGIQECFNLFYLANFYNNKITDVSHLTELESLYTDDQNLTNNFKAMKLDQHGSTVTRFRDDMNRSHLRLVD